MDKYTGLYKALVVDNADSQGLNRVKIRVKGLMDGIPDSYLPWAKYHSPTPGAQGGSTYQPAVDSKVWVHFSDGDVNDAYYMGGAIEVAADLPSKKADGRFILYQSPNKGITITVNEDSEDIEIQTGSYNTTLGTIIDKFLAHTQSYDKVSSVTAPPGGGLCTIVSVSTETSTPSGISASDFNGGTL